MPLIPFGRTALLAIGVVIGTAAVLMSTIGVSRTNMRLEPQQGTVVVGETFTISVNVMSDIPVNVFTGDISFDQSVLQVASIDYNTSIADLWAEEPWYSNGDGTLNFIGGTTRPGGFSGKGTLLTITFKTLAPKTTTIDIDEVRILKYDGLGTDAMVGEPIDGIFTVTKANEPPLAIIEKVGAGPKVSVLPLPPTTDLNGDGKQTAVDVSIFMTDLITQNKRSDFNQDGSVNTKDLSVILNAE